MSNPWFPEYLAGAVAGSVLGVLAGLWGATAGVLAPRGRAKWLVVGLAWLILASSAASLAVGVIAYGVGQPYGIWYGFGLAGLIGLVVVGVNFFTVRAAYRAAERRKLEARDLT